ncbi:MAG TPA: retropepsin-like aspartic protease [Candidatus Obscuribacterales bacterium]
MFNYGNFQNRWIPSPQTCIQIYSPEDQLLTTEVNAIVDSGAVMSAIPLQAIEEINERSLDYSWITVRGAIGKEQRRKTYIINIRLGNYYFDDWEVIAIDKEYGLIGRDILNQYKIILDAPNGTWSIEESS